MAKHILFGKKQKTTFQDFLSGTPARNYVFQQTPYEQQIRQAAELIKDADYILIGAGAGLTHVFATQGDYGLIQCKKGCHPKTYDAVELFRQMDQERKDCLVPAYLVPKCPICGGQMEMNLRSDQYFVEDEKWQEAQQHFGEALTACEDKKTVLLELGVGFNTPTIIRFPFEKLMREHKNMSLIRLNLDEAIIPEELEERSVGINEDMEKSISDLLKEVKGNGE